MYAALNRPMFRPSPGGVPSGGPGGAASMEGVEMQPDPQPSAPVPDGPTSSGPMRETPEARRARLSSLHRALDPRNNPNDPRNVPLPDEPGSQPNVNVTDVDGNDTYNFHFAVPDGATSSMPMDGGQKRGADDTFDTYGRTWGSGARVRL